jgi:hypothetical protein
MAASSKKSTHCWPPTNTAITTEFCSSLAVAVIMRLARVIVLAPQLPFLVLVLLQVIGFYLQQFCDELSIMPRASLRITLAK